MEKYIDKNLIENFTSAPSMTPQNFTINSIVTYDSDTEKLGDTIIHNNFMGNTYKLVSLGRSVKFKCLIWFIFYKLLVVFSFLFSNIQFKLI